MALKNKSEFPITYNKTRLSGSNNANYTLHSKGACMPGLENLYTPSSKSKPSHESNIYQNCINNAFKRERERELHSPKGEKYMDNSLDCITYESFHPSDDETLRIALNCAYLHVFGNSRPMESEKPIDLERRLRNGDINMREFIRRLVKTEFYKSNYYEKVNQIKVIEYSFIHILGRMAKSSKEIESNIFLINESGFESHVDSLIDSLEYEQIFGADTVPYIRSLDSPCGLKTSSYINYKNYL